MFDESDDPLTRVVRDRKREECKKCGEAQLVHNGVCELSRMRGYKATCALQRPGPEEYVD